QSVLDNVRIGGHAHSRSDFVSDTLRLPWVRRHEAALSEVAWSLLQMLDLEAVALRPAAGLPLGTRKRVKLARALAGSPKLLLLEVELLDAFYGETQALFGVDFALDDGEVRTLLGANGAGKTTVLRALCGMVRPGGEVRLDGKRISGWATEDIVRLGIAPMPDGRGTFLRVSVEENLQLGAITRRDRPQIAADIERVYQH